MARTFAQGGDERDIADRVVVEQLEWGQASNGFSVMAFDVPPARAYDADTDGVYVSVRGTATEEITRYRQALVVVGGTVRAEPTPGRSCPPLRDGHRPLPLPPPPPRGACGKGAGPRPGC